MPNITNATDAKQLDLFYADTRFFMILNSLITSGEAAKLGANAILIYLILKVNADYSSGLARVGVRRLSELSGIKSYQTVSKALQTLLDHSLIMKAKEAKGTRTIYEVKDTVTFYDREGTEAGKAVVPYQPMHLKRHLQDVKDALRSGEVPKTSAVTLTLNIIMTNGNNNTVNVSNININNNEHAATHNLEELPEQIRIFLSRMLNKKEE